MRFAEYLRPGQVTERRLFVQAGVTDAVYRLPEADTNAAVLDLAGLERARAELAADGLTLSVVEPVPPMEAVKQGLPGRDRELARLTALIEAMGRLGIPVLCYNFMAVFGWTRSHVDLPGRGGATVSGFNLDAFERAAPAAHHISDDDMWAHYRYFLDAVLPAAERAGVTLALHPDDPPVPSLRGVARIMRSPDNIARALAMSDSPAHQLTFCQGTFATMGADIPATIRRFADRIAFVHFRDIRGEAADFVETFHDEGKTDMYAAMRAYVEIGFSGPVRTDHAPTMYGESNDHPGYATLGRLFAIGYLKGLYEAARAGAAS
ncbi:mannonate dehydratase [Phytohabitans sp. ZYX-F-186]|uniref:mannonate dehydratase n=1 Tax=Phytohabitans maris TaxID=3071409 RepID=A0ABU0ZST6_9ACTN|nr:mannonate dehydratase [Phytohabitans sp. ZYX-F-186]MDQ7910098.1 mannonate dehydratase [Phytohabitans sp. ZYX-F-186]